MYSLQGYVQCQDQTCAVGLQQVSVGPTRLGSIALSCITCCWIHPFEQRVPCLHRCTVPCQSRGIKQDGSGTSAEDMQQQVDLRGSRLDPSGVGARTVHQYVFLYVVGLCDYSCVLQSALCIRELGHLKCLSVFLLKRVMFMYDPNMCCEACFCLC